MKKVYHVWIYIDKKTNYQASFTSLKEAKKHAIETHENFMKTIKSDIVLLQSYFSTSVSCFNLETRTHIYVFDLKRHFFD